jgi:glutamate synthase (NADPH) large chain
VPDTLDAEIIRDAARFFEDGEKMQLSYRAQHPPHHRHAGQPYRASVRDAQQLQPDHLTVKLTGSAGSRWAPSRRRGLKLEVSGDANDYVGKGLSGGT